MADSALPFLGNISDNLQCFWAGTRNTSCVGSDRCSHGESKMARCGVV